MLLSWRPPCKTSGLRPQLLVGADGSCTPVLCPSLGAVEQAALKPGPLELLGESNSTDVGRGRSVAYDSCCFPAKATDWNGRACKDKSISSRKSHT